MIFLLIFIFGLYLAAKCAPVSPPVGAVPTWRCTLKNKAVVTVIAETEADAVKALLRQKIDVTKITMLERVA